MSYKLVAEPVAYKTYKKLAKRYGIRLSVMRDGKRYPKSYSQLKKQIYNHEKRNNITNGLYF